LLIEHEAMFVRVHKLAGADEYFADAGKVSRRVCTLPGSRGGLFRRTIRSAGIERVWEAVHLLSMISGAISTANCPRRRDERINLAPMEILVDVGKRLSAPIKKVRNHFRIAFRLCNLGLLPHSFGRQMFWISNLFVPQ
jgi:hypothetical protein